MEKGSQMNSRSFHAGDATARRENRRWARSLLSGLALVTALGGLSIDRAFGFERAIYEACAASSCSPTRETCTDACLSMHCSLFHFFTLRCNLDAADECSDACFNQFRSCLGGCSNLTGQIDSVATLSSDGHRIRVRGPIDCDDDLDVDLSVTITRRTSGALAKGAGRASCTADRWEIEAWPRRSGPFEVGQDATVCVLARFRDDSRVVDAQQWCEDVTLSEFVVEPN
jgi:hypothetical protein